nr:ATP-binding cassette domain-containing protein [candidate division Zixibacteria bacterium]
MIEFNRVSYAYPGGRRALRNITLKINKGERVIILGSNGSGKTTLALLVDGILRPTEGTILIGGINPVDVQNTSLIRHRVGLVFQNPDNQLVTTTVERELAFSLENRNVSFEKMHIQVERMLDYFGLKKFRKRLTSELSGGEKQRLALAAVMAAGPDILILDEPGSYLDESGKRLLNDAIALLLSENKDLTVLRITQYSEIAADQNRLLVFHQGALVADDHPEAIFSKPKKLAAIGLRAPLKNRLPVGLLGRVPEMVSESANNSQLPHSITIDSLSFGYDVRGSGYLFDNLNLKIESGKIHGLVGPSGSGKTTLIQLMAGLLKPDKGTIRYSNFRPDPGRLAVSFQQPERQFFLDTVNQEIRFGAENLGLPDIDSIAEGCYHLIGMPRSEYADRNPFTLSGGEKRRLAFGCILSLDPAFVFFDEPTCGLDPDGVERFEALVARLQHKKIGVVIVSHYGDVIFDLADKVVTLDGGRIADLMDKPDFFRKVDYSSYLSVPELVAYQLKTYGEVLYFKESDLPDEI